jgi:hypothetical protein
LVAAQVFRPEITETTSLEKIGVKIVCANWPS